MAPSVDSEIVSIRERLARIETTLDMIKKSLECTAKGASPGSIVLPVTVVVAAIELAKEVVTRFV